MASFSVDIHASYWRVTIMARARQRRDHLLTESIVWISQNMTATNLDVPTHLLDEWLFIPTTTRRDPMGFLLSVFTFGHCCQGIHAGALPIDDTISISTADLMQQFTIWQFKLGLAKIQRVTDFPFRPLPLFRCSRHELVEFYNTPEIRPRWVQPGLDDRIVGAWKRKTEQTPAATKGSA